MSRLSTPLTTAALAVALALPALADAQTGAAGRTTATDRPADATGTITGTPGGVQQPMTSGPGASERTDARAGSLSMHHTDRRFLTRAHADGLAEIELGRLAQQKGASETVRRFGQRMVDEHTKSNAQLVQMAKTKGAVLNDDLDPAHRAMRVRLERLSGEEFDRAYLRGQVTDHRRAIERYEGQARGGRDAELKRMAADALPMLREHLQAATQAAR